MIHDTVILKSNLYVCGGPRARGFLLFAFTLLPLPCRRRRHVRACFIFILARFIERNLSRDRSSP